MNMVDKNDIKDSVDKIVDEHGGGVLNRVGEIVTIIVRALQFDERDWDDVRYVVEDYINASYPPAHTSKSSRSRSGHRRRGSSSRDDRNGTRPGSSKEYSSKGRRKEKEPREPEALEYKYSRGDDTPITYEVSIEKGRITSVFKSKANTLLTTAFLRPSRSLEAHDILELKNSLTGGGCDLGLGGEILNPTLRFVEFINKALVSGSVGDIVSLKQALASASSGEIPPKLMHLNKLVDGNERHIEDAITENEIADRDYMSIYYPAKAGQEELDKNKGFFINNPLPDESELAVRLSTAGMITHIAGVDTLYRVENESKGFRLYPCLCRQFFG